jgi:hypothetical protein
VSALEGREVKVTNTNINGLSQLCEEFRFRELDGRLSQFRDCTDSTEDVVLLSREIASLRCELSRVHNLLEERLRTEAESASGRANEVEQQVAEVRSEVSHLVNALREVRELAEGAQTKAASTDARLDAELSALRGASVLPAPVPLARPPAVVPMAPAPAPTDLPPLSTQKSTPGSAAPPPPQQSTQATSSPVAASSPQKQFAIPVGWTSAISPDFPALFDDFKKKQFTLLWRGSRDGFCARYFHDRCDWHPNTLTVILDTGGNIFGGFTPVEWDWVRKHKSDLSLKSFVFTLKNPHNVPARRFALKNEHKDKAILCSFEYGPYFPGGIAVFDDCNANTDNVTKFFGETYTNDTGLNGKTFFTGSKYFRVKEIEVFEIKD